MEILTGGEDDRKEQKEKKKLFSVFTSSILFSTTLGENFLYLNNTSRSLHFFLINSNKTQPNKRGELLSASALLTHTVNFHSQAKWSEGNPFPNPGSGYSLALALFLSELINETEREAA